MARIKLELPSQFSFTTIVPVRIQDLNYGGHVGNDALLSIIHEARMQYLSSLGCTELDACGVAMIMADAVLIFKGEGFYGDRFEIAVTASDFTGLGFDLFYKITALRAGNRVHIAEAKTGMICFDYNKRKKMRMPDLLLQKLQNLSS